MGPQRPEDKQIRQRQEKSSLRPLLRNLKSRLQGRSPEVASIEVVVVRLGRY